MTRTTERVAQKERTRQLLLRSARELVDEGEELSMARIAERADVGEATVYRYYSNPRSLLRAALAIEWPELDTILAKLRGMPSIADRAERAGREIASFVLGREASIRKLFATTDQEPRDPGGPAGLPAGSFRRRLVAEVLAGAEAMPATEVRRLELALIVILSPHAVLALRDAMPNQGSAVSTELGRMARQLFDRAPGWR